MDVSAFEAVLLQWIKSQLPEESLRGLQSIAIDGKTLRGSKSQNLPGVHLLSAFAAHSSVVLAQVAVNQRNEITQAQPLLQQVACNGKVVTGDAIFNQRSICKGIVSQGGHYLFEVKGNQSDLKAAIARLFLGGLMSEIGHKQLSKPTVATKSVLCIPNPSSHSS